MWGIVLLLGFISCIDAASIPKTYIYAGTDGTNIWADSYDIDMDDLTADKSYGSYSYYDSDTPSSRYGHGMVVNGYFNYLWGGTSDGSVCPKGMYKLDRSSPNFWLLLTPSGTEPAGRQAFGMVTYRSAAYIFGGRTSGTTDSAIFSLGIMNIFNMTTNAWSQATIANPPDIRYWFGYAACNSKIYVLGGRKTSVSFSDFWAFDPAARTWTQLTSFPPGARISSTLTCVGTDVWQIGGENGNTKGIADLNTYSTLTAAWTSRSTTAGVATFNHETIYYNGNVYVFGGRLGSSATYSNNLYKCVLTYKCTQQATDPNTFSSSVLTPRAQTKWVTSCFSLDSSTGCIPCTICAANRYASPICNFTTDTVCVLCTNQIGCTTSASRCSNTTGYTTKLSCTTPAAGYVLNGDIAQLASATRSPTTKMPTTSMPTSQPTNQPTTVQPTKTPSRQPTASPTIATSRPQCFVTQDVAQKDPANALPLVFNVWFSQPVTGLNITDFTVSRAAGTFTLTLTTINTSYYKLQVTALTADSPPVVISLGSNTVNSIASGQPNDASGASDNSVSVDRVRPTIVFLSQSSQYYNVSPMLFTVVFSEPIQNANVSGITLSQSCCVGTNYSIGLNMTGCVPPCTSFGIIVNFYLTGQGAISLTFNQNFVQDVAGNPVVQFVASSVTIWDNVPPSCNVAQSSTQADPTNQTPIFFQITFNEPVTGMNGPDATLLSSPVYRPLNLVSNASTGTAFTITVYNTINAQLLAMSYGANLLTDLAGNSNLACSTGDNTVQYDATTFAVTSMTLYPGQASTTNQSPLLWMVCFGRAIVNSSFSNSDVTLSPTGLTPTITQLNSTCWKLSVAGMGASDASISPSLAFAVVQDAAGNPNQASTTSDTIKWDVTKPQANVQSRISGLTNAFPLPFQIDLSESMTFNASWVNLSLKLSFGSLSVASILRSLTNLTATSYILNLNSFGATEGVISAQVPANVFSDSAGNMNSLGTHPNDTIAFDFVTQPPKIYNPPSNFSVSNLFLINIAETPRVNSVVLRFIRASDGLVTNTTLALFSAGNYSVTFNLADLSSAYSVSGIGLVPGSIYTVSLSYIDQIGNSQAQANSTNVLYPAISGVLCTSGCSNLPVIGTTTLTVSGVFATPGLTGLGATVTFGGQTCTGAVVTQSQITCTTSPGIGANLQLSVMLTHYNNYLILGPSLSYAAPYITNNTLRLNSPSNPTNLSPSVTAGQLVFFSGGNFGTDRSKVSVTFGPEDFVCTIQNFSSSQIGCVLAVGTGSSLRFTVLAGGQSSLDQSTDFAVSYSTVTLIPVVNDVSGCVKSGQGTIQCPTTGESSPGVPLVLTLLGVNFQPPALVFICSSNAVLLNANDTMITVQLPVGSGSSCDVRVQPLNSISSFVPRPLVAYASPSITSVFGCTNSAGGPVSCNPLGGDTITINGTNFGPSGARVFIASQSLECSNVTHAAAPNAHNQLSCQLPASRGTNLTIFVAQSNGQNMGSNASLTISYRLCIPGQYVYAGSTCSTCGAGTYSAIADATTCINCSVSQYNSFAGATSCSLCPAGSFCPSNGIATPPLCANGTFSSTQGLSVCSPCDAGQYSDSVGLTGCSMCQPGKFSSMTAQSQCIQCDVGTYNPNQGASVCEQCPVGSVTSSLGTTLCSVCLAGKFANQSLVCSNCSLGTYQGSSAATECLSCDTGKFSASVGSAQCLICSPGSVQASSGQSSCSLCQSGKYGPVGGLTSCLDCRAGTSNSDTGATDCPPCELGEFSSMSGQQNCTLCDAGMFTAVSGSSGCQQCIGGTYSSSPGASQCDQCDPNTFSLIGQENCTTCAPGSSSSSGQPACSPCPVGKASASGSCVDCQPGNYTDTPGSIQCQQCPIGTFGALSALSVCSFCDSGTFGDQMSVSTCKDCPIGRSSSLRGASSCALCDVGYYGPRIRGSQCLPCQAGQYSSDQGVSACTDCPAGQYANVEGLSICQQCVRGTYSLGAAKNCLLCQLGRYAVEAGTSSCINCPAGTFSLQEGAMSCPACPIGRSAASGAECSQCSPSFANPWTGQAFCFSCDANSKPNVESTDCLCNPGFYQLNRSACDALHSGFAVDSSAPSTCNAPFVCAQCPLGADCEQRGTLEDSLVALSGYWKDPSTNTFWHCPFTHCLGETAICSANRMGPLCSLCTPGHVSTTMASSCDLCPPTRNSTSYTAGIFVLVVFVLLIVCLAVVRLSQDAVAMAEKDRQAKSAPSTQGSIGRDSSLERSSSIKTKNVVPSLWRTSSRAPRDSTEDHGDDDQDPATKVFAKVSRKPDIMFKLKVLISFIQISYALSALGVIWPSMYVEFMSNFRFLNFDFIPWQSVGCLTQIDYLTKATVVALLPPFVAVLLALLFFLPLWLVQVCTRDMSDTQSRIDRVKARNQKLLIQAARLGFFLIFLVYPYLCSTIVNIYNCTTILDDVYMTFDFSVKCTSDRWILAASAHVASLIVYPIGIPLLYYIRMYTYYKNNRLNEPIVRATMGFLYDAYTATNWYFEVVDMIFKLFMTSILALFASIYSLQIAMGVIIAYLGVHLLIVPYVRKGDDRIHILCLSELFLIALAGLVINSEGLSEATNVVLSVLLIFLSIFFFLVLLLISFRNVVKILRNSKLVKRLRVRGIASASPSLGPVLGSSARDLRVPEEFRLDTENPLRSSTLRASGISGGDSMDRSE